MRRFCLPAASLSSFENVRPGNYTVEVDAPGYKKAVQPVTLNVSGETSIVYITMERDSTLILFSEKGNLLFDRSNHLALPHALA